MSSSPSSLSLKLGEPTVQVVLHSSAASVFSSAKSIVQRRFDKMCVLSGSSSKRDKIPRYYHCRSFTTLWLRSVSRELSATLTLFQSWQLDVLAQLPGDCLDPHLLCPRSDLPSAFRGLHRLFHGHSGQKYHRQLLLVNWDLDTRKEVHINSWFLE